MKRKAHTARAAQVRPALLVVVHPGSLCGSFWFNGGTAAVLRPLLREIAKWPGPVVGIANALHDELDGDDEVAGAYRPAVCEEFEADGFTDELRAAVIRLLEAFPAETVRAIKVTGAWVGEDGCASFVAEELRRRVGGSVPVEISEFAARQAAAA